MIFTFELEPDEEELISMANESMKALNNILKESTLEGNNEVIVSPKAQATIMELNGYVGDLKQRIINQLNLHVETVSAQLDSLINFTKAAEGVINKAQRATSQIVSMMKRM